MHNTGLAHLGLDYAYLPFAIAPNDLSQALAGFRAIGLRGFSVTIPHKQAIIPLLNEVSDLARAVGAVNTVWRTEQGWNGTNTDVVGFVSPLANLQQQWQETVAVVLGNGGAARAVVAGCAQLGCARVQVVGRNRQKLAAFQQSWLNSPFAVNLSTHPWEELPALLPQANLLVNTTPIGMAPQAQAAPLSPSEMAQVQPGTIAYDLIYTPRPTQFLQQAAAQGAVTLDGLEMLVQQGAAAWELWLERSAPVDVMRAALLAQLQQR